MEDIEIRARVQALSELLGRYDRYSSRDDFLRMADTAKRIVEAVRMLLPWMQETSFQNSSEIAPKTP